MAALILTQNVSILTATRTGLYTVEIWITAWRKMTSTFSVKYLDNTMQCAIQNTGLKTSEKPLENISSYHFLLPLKVLFQPNICFSVNTINN